MIKFVDIFYERSGDKSKLEYASGLVEKWINEYIDYIEKDFNFIFKNIRYKINDILYPNILDIFVGFESDPKSQPINYRGKYIPSENRIHIVDGVISNLNHEYFKLRDGYRGMRSIDIRSVVKHKEVAEELKSKLLREHENKAKKLKDILINSLRKDKEFRSILIHEVIHVLEYHKRPDSASLEALKIHDKIKNIKDKKRNEFQNKINNGELSVDEANEKYFKFNNYISLKHYINSPIELDAYFLDTYYAIMDNDYKSFNNMLKDFKDNFDFWDELSERNKKRYTTRLYTLFDS